jgi:hypothetical protein
MVTTRTATRATLRDLGWEIAEFLDPSHTKKSILKHLTTVFRDYTAKAGELREPFGNWLNNIIYEPSLDGRWYEKRRRWLNAAAHLSGDHEHCDHSARRGDCPWSGARDLIFQGILRIFLENTLETISQTDRCYTTNFNEPLNSTKAKFAPNNMLSLYHLRSAAVLLSSPETIQRLGITDRRLASSLRISHHSSVKSLRKQSTISTEMLRIGLLQKRDEKSLDNESNTNASCMHLPRARNWDWNILGMMNTLLIPSG